MCNRSERLSLWMRSITLKVMGVFSAVFSRLAGRPIPGSVVSYVKGLKMVIND